MCPKPKTETSRELNGQSWIIFYQSPLTSKSVYTRHTFSGIAIVNGNPSGHISSDENSGRT